MWTRIVYNDPDDNGKHVHAVVYIEADSMRDAVEQFEEKFYDVKKRDIISVTEDEPENIRMMKRHLEFEEAQRKHRTEQRKKELEERRLFLKSLSTKELAAFLRREEDEADRKEFEREAYL